MPEPMEEGAAVEAIENAMQKYWDDFCSDTGCVPPEFSIRGPRTTRVYADFRGGEMAAYVAEYAYPALLAELRRQAAVVEAARKQLRNWVAVAKISDGPTDLTEETEAWLDALDTP